MSSLPPRLLVLLQLFEIRYHQISTVDTEWSIYNNITYSIYLQPGGLEHYSLPGPGHYISKRISHARIYRCLLYTS